MSDIEDQDDLHSESHIRIVRSRPSLAQVKAIVEFMQHHPDLAQKKYRYGMSHEKFTKLWIELSNIANSIDGAVKSTKGWIKFWSDKKRSLRLKQKQIHEGKSSERLSPIERKIIELSFETTTSRKKKTVKSEPCNGNDDYSMDDTLFANAELDFKQAQITGSEADERQISIMEKLVSVMDQQALAMNQIAQASLNNAKALERHAEASHIQALAVDRLSNTFENICASVHDVRNSIMSIDYSMKRCYTTPAPAQHRQNSNIFS